MENAIFIGLYELYALWANLRLDWNFFSITYFYYCMLYKQQYISKKHLLILASMQQLKLLKVHNSKHFQPSLSLTLIFNYSLRHKQSGLHLNLLLFFALRSLSFSRSIYLSAIRSDSRCKTTSSWIKYFSLFFHFNFFCSQLFYFHIAHYIRRRWVVRLH